MLISSGQPDIEDWACLRRPGVAVISKPFNLEEIQAKLGEFARAPVPFRPPAGPPIAGTAPALPSAPDSCLPG